MSSAPPALAGLSPAQRQVLVALKRRGEATAEELAEDLGITASGVRQHLATLKSSGVISSRQARGRPGRPADIFHSTELADAHFQSGADGLTRELLDLMAEEDPQLLPRILDRRRGHRVDQVRDLLAGEEGLEAKMDALVRLLDGEGYLADVERSAGETYRLTLHNCAIWALASQYGETCDSELDLLREVLPGASIERFSHKVAGAFVCGYEIRPLLQTH
ncbi:MAG TPA: ArsR family transcriptional regulator [Acidimicrobiales bacterium]|nr:ArsR family transcriptional regulator [Acidimicrobiales bacterium]